MKHKERIIFTDSRHSKRGIMSVVLSVICIASLAYSFLMSFGHRGEIQSNFGAALVVTLVMSVVGIGLGASAKADSDRFMLFPILGIVLNTVVLVLLALLLWVGTK